MKPTLSAGPWPEWETHAGYLDGLRDGPNRTGSRAVSQIMDTTKPLAPTAKLAALVATSDVVRQITWQQIEPGQIAITAVRTFDVVDLIVTPQRLATFCRMAYARQSVGSAVHWLKTGRATDLGTFRAGRAAVAAIESVKEKAAAANVAELIRLSVELDKVEPVSDADLRARAVGCTT